MRNRFVSLVAAVALCCLCWSEAQVLSLGPSSEAFVSPQVVGSEDSGVSVSFYGCLNGGATLQNFTLWANVEFIRGMSVTLTNGSTVLYGCVNVTGDGAGGDGCNSTDVRSSSFRFQAGERVRNMTMWPGYNEQKQPNQRAGAVTFTTSLGNTFDFGMTDARINPVIADIGSGIPCGVNNRAGADIDALGFVFLRPVTSAELINVQYEGVSSATDMGPQGFVEGNSTILTLSNQTYNNSVQTTNLTATFASEAPAETVHSWTTDPGLDSYLASTVRAAIPNLSSNTSADMSSSWTLSSAARYNRSDSSSSPRTWNYTVDILPGGISRVEVTALQSEITTAYSGTLNVTLDSGFALTIPVEGTYEGQDTSTTSVLTTEIQAGRIPSSHSKGSNTLAWVLGVILGIVGGLLIAALLAWLIIAHMRKKQQQQQPREGDSKPGKPPHSFFVLPGAGKAGGKGQKATDSSDIEMASAKTGGKKGWDSDEKPNTVMGVPVNGSQGARQDGGLPENEGGFVVSYNKFRRLRLESIRHALGLAEAGSTANQEAPAAADNGTYNPPRNTPEGLSNPPSGASTPTSISNSLLPAATKFDSELAKQSPPAKSEEDQKSETGREDHMTPSPVPIRSRSPRKASNEGLYSSKIKDRVAAIRAERQGNTTPSPRSSPTPAAKSAVASPPQAATSEAPQSPNLKTTSTVDKGKMMFQKLRGSISSTMARSGTPGKIEHDNTSISLTGKPKVASQATPVEAPGATPRPATPRAAGVTPSTTPKAAADPSKTQGSTPRGSQPQQRSPRASTPRAATPTSTTPRSLTPRAAPAKDTVDKSVANRDQPSSSKASTLRRSTSKTPAPSTPSQPSPRGNAKAVWEEGLPELKLTPRASAKSNKFMDFDDQQIKLGEKYLTQGRNE